MDPHLDLPDAHDFEALLAREELRRSRTGEDMSVAILDVDGLRTVTARYGPAAGSEILRRCTEALRATLRGVDEVARTGPDEFSVLLHAARSRSAATWADRFEDELERSTTDHPAAPVTCALGLADTDEGMTLFEVAARARGRMEVVQTVRKLRRAREGGS